MFVTTVPNRGSPSAVLLRESYREDGKVKTRTLANLSHWPDEKVQTLRAALRGDKLVPAGEGGFEIRRSLPHGHVLAALAAARRIGLDDLLPDGFRRRRVNADQHRAWADEVRLYRAPRGAEFWCCLKEGLLQTKASAISRRRDGASEAPRVTAPRGRLARSRHTRLRNHDRAYLDRPGTPAFNATSSARFDHRASLPVIPGLDPPRHPRARPGDQSTHIRR